MIAELYGKISSAGNNLNDRLEDNLTGDVFGTMRYLPFVVGIAPILRASRIKELSNILENIKLDFWAEQIVFWPYHEQGELDVLIDLEHAVIGIETKYFSGLSSDDSIDNSSIEIEEIYKESKNQLARESRIIGEKAGCNKKAFLIFIASDSVCASVCNNVTSRAVLDNRVSLGYISWQEILIQLTQMSPESEFHKLIISDLIALLKKKKFDRFHTFDLSIEIHDITDTYFFFDYEYEKDFTFFIPNQVNRSEFYEYR